MDTTETHENDQLDPTGGVATAEAPEEAEVEQAQPRQHPDAVRTGGADRAFSDDRASGTPSVIERSAASQAEAGRVVEEGDEIIDAMEWLLGNEEAGGEQTTQKWKVNVGSDEEPRYVEWEITSVDADTMNNLRQQSRIQGGNRAQRRGKQSGDEIDTHAFYLRLVAAGTISPDLREAAKRRDLDAADPMLGPVTLLQGMFRLKPGRIAQLAGYIMQFSGYDEDDVVRATPEITMVRAAGNSSGRVRS